MAAFISLFTFSRQLHYGNADAQAQRTVIGSNRTIPERAEADPQRKTDLSFAGIVSGL
ncbi:hypothetical protein PEC302107_13100 [Pectobacterium araliae]|uniref:Uncharacterized protein n=1 Tax=Pectobacterium araliae TaxID=3073862 RepID=A0AAN0K9S1_9GAMM|nr:hypothetical protein PEC302110_13360 [Pectobacterium sp. MAFF 302110]GKW19581.1 hypothetical protein PEC302107_13100 [Pectobacterium carotovorum subsp. carotovorum]